jgi:hypothetical protein
LAGSANGYVRPAQFEFDGHDLAIAEVKDPLETQTSLADVDEQTTVIGAQVHIG